MHWESILVRRHVSFKRLVLDVVHRHVGFKRFSGQGTQLVCTGVWVLRG